jgi:hypothetical protein
MPISVEQHAANRANATQSAGPRTPQGKAACQIPGHRRRTPSGSQSQFPTTPIGSTNSWVRSFTLPCPDPDSPSLCRPALESPEPIRSSAVQRNPRKPRIQSHASFRGGRRYLKRVRSLRSWAPRRREPLLTFKRLPQNGYPPRPQPRFPPPCYIGISPHAN